MADAEVIGCILLFQVSPKIVLFLEIFFRSRAHHHHGRNRHNNGQIADHIFPQVLRQPFLFTKVIDHQLVDTDLLVNSADHDFLVNRLVGSPDKVAVEIDIEIIHRFDVRKRNKRNQIIHIEGVLRQLHAALS